MNVNPVNQDVRHKSIPDKEINKRNNSPKKKTESYTERLKCDIDYMPDDRELRQFFFLSQFLCYVREKSTRTSVLQITCIAYPSLAVNCIDYIKDMLDTI